MPMMAARTMSPCSLAHSPTDCSVPASALTIGVATLKASPTSLPAAAAAPPFSPISRRPVAASCRPWNSWVRPCQSSPSAARNACTPPVSASVPMKMLTLRVSAIHQLTSAEMTLFRPTRKLCMPPPLVMTSSRLLPNAAAFAPRPVRYRPSLAKSPCQIETSGLAACAAWPSQFLTPVTMLAAASPILPNCELKSLIAPAMFSTPMASMTFWTALATRLRTFSNAVPMPWVASLACWAKLAYWAKPCLLRRMTVLLKSSKL